MNKLEALEVLRAKLDEYRRRSYGELAELVGQEEHLCVAGPSGTEYQVEIQVLWDRAGGKKVLVLGSVDDGGLRAFVPVTETFLVSPPEIEGSAFPAPWDPKPR